MYYNVFVHISLFLFALTSCERTHSAGIDGERGADDEQKLAPLGSVGSITLDKIEPLGAKLEKAVAAGIEDKSQAEPETVALHDDSLEATKPEKSAPTPEKSAPTPEKGTPRRWWLPFLSDDGNDDDHKAKSEELSKSGDQNSTNKVIPLLPGRNFSIVYDNAERVSHIREDTDDGVTVLKHVARRNAAKPSKTIGKGGKLSVKNGA